MNNYEIQKIRKYTYYLDKRVKELEEHIAILEEHINILQYLMEKNKLNMYWTEH